MNVAANKNAYKELSLPRRAVRTGWGSVTVTTRVAFASSGPKRGWLYVADSSEDKVVPLIIPRIAPNLVPPRPVTPPRKVGG